MISVRKIVCLAADLAITITNVKRARQDILVKKTVGNVSAICIIVPGVSEIFVQNVFIIPGTLNPMGVAHVVQIASIMNVSLMVHVPSARIRTMGQIANPGVVLTVRMGCVIEIVAVFSANMIGIMGHLAPCHAAEVSLSV